MLLGLEHWYSPGYLGSVLGSVSAVVTTRALLCPPRDGHPHLSATLDGWRVETTDGSSIARLRNVGTTTATVVSIHRLDRSDDLVIPTTLPATVRPQETLLVVDERHLGHARPLRIQVAWAGRAGSIGTTDLTVP